MSKLLITIGSLLIVMSLWACRTARQGPQEASSQAVSFSEQDSCLQLRQMVTAYWAFDSIAHIYFLRPDTAEMEIGFFLQLFSDYKNCFLGKNPLEASRSIGEPTKVLHEQTGTQEYNVYLFHFSLIPTRGYRKDAFLKIQDRNDTISAFIDGGESIFMW